MAVTDFFAGEIATELLKQLFLISAKAWRYKNIADNLISLIKDNHPTIKEIQYSVELPAHRKAQIRILTGTLKKGKELTDKILRARRWSMFLQLTLAREMEKLEKTVSVFLKAPILTQILADVHLLRAKSDFDKSLDEMTERLGSMKIGVGGLIMDAMKRAEATMEIDTEDDLENLGVGLELGKRKVKKMMFDAEGGLFGISGMSGVGKTTLARELERDDEVRRHFENRILFLTVSQSRILEELRAHIWGFLSGYEGINPALNWKFQFEGGIKMRKLVILDDVWTREALDLLMFRGCTTLVVSRSKLTDPKNTYDVELLSKDEAITLFCLCAFGQKSVPSGFSKDLVKQVADECKGLPLALKVTGASLKDRPEKYWEGVLQRLSRGEPADETHEIRLLHQMEVSLENLDPKSRECFLDLGAFPGDRKIRLDVFINMWTEVHDLLKGYASFSSCVQLQSQNRVFINFRGAQLRMGFVSHLVKALEKDGINVFIDEKEYRGEDLTRLFTRIEESKIAIVIFSSMYTESKWCLDELEKIKECVDLGKLVVIPVFYKIKINDVRHMKGPFGAKFRELAPKHGKEDKWREVVETVSKKFCIAVDNNRKESEFVDQIVGEVMKVLTHMSAAADPPLFGIEKRLKKIEELLAYILNGNSNSFVPSIMASSSSSSLQLLPYFQGQEGFRQLSREGQIDSSPFLKSSGPLHSQHITADADLVLYLNTTRTYLGRPWKQFSRTIFMRNKLSNVVRPEGWLERNADFALDTLLRRVHELRARFRTKQPSQMAWLPRV